MKYMMIVFLLSGLVCAMEKDGKEVAVEKKSEQGGQAALPSHDEVQSARRARFSALTSEIACGNYRELEKERLRELFFSYLEARSMMVLSSFAGIKGSGPSLRQSARSIYNALMDKFEGTADAKRLAAKVYLDHVADDFSDDEAAFGGDIDLEGVYESSKRRTTNMSALATSIDAVLSEMSVLEDTKLRHMGEIMRLEGLLTIERNRKEAAEEAIRNREDRKEELRGQQELQKSLRLRNKQWVTAEREKLQAQLDTIVDELTKARKELADLEGNKAKGSPCANYSIVHANKLQHIRELTIAQQEKEAEVVAVDQKLERIDEPRSRVGAWKKNLFG